MRKLIASIAALALLLSACSSTDVEETMEVLEETEESISHAPGEIPLDFAPMATTAQTGEYVLAPSSYFIESMFEDYENYASLSTVIYSQQMVTPGEFESEVESPFESYTAPNSLIIPLAKGATAEPGDMVLTWWQTGSGMQRAYVVEGGTPTEPKVLYLDLDYDNPSTDEFGTPISQLVDQLEADSFVNLTDAPEFAPGKTVAINEGSEYGHYIVVASSGEQLLLNGFAGSYSVANIADAIELPLLPSVTVGDTVYYSEFGAMNPGGVVTKVDTEIGRVFVEYEFAGSMEETAFAFGDIVSNL